LQDPGQLFGVHEEAMYIDVPEKMPKFINIILALLKFDYLVFHQFPVSSSGFCVVALAYLWCINT
jgi:hypothetical protein